MQDDRAGAVQFLALQIAIDDRRQILVGHGGGKAALDHVERLDRALIIVFPMRADQLFRQAGELGGVKAQGLGAWPPERRGLGRTPARWLPGKAAARQGHAKGDAAQSVAAGHVSHG
jgi:hypothetical protein